MPERGFKGIWIPSEIWLDDRINATEKVILAEIDSLDVGEDGCYASNEHLAAFCQCSEWKVSTAISKLIKLGYIKTLSFDGRVRKIKSCIGNYTKPPCENQKADMGKTQESNIDSNIDSKESMGRKRVAFVPPTLQEVEEYAREKGYTQREFDPESFINFYGSKGWVVGKSKMKDWKKAASGWVSRYRKEHGVVKSEPIERDMSVSEIIRRSMG